MRAFALDRLTMVVLMERQDVKVGCGDSLTRDGRSKEAEDARGGACMDGQTKLHVSIEGLVVPPYSTFTLLLSCLTLQYYLL